MTAKCKFHKKCFRKGIQILNASICLMLCVLCFVDCRLATPVPFKVDVIDNLHLLNLKTLDATLDHGAVRSKRQLTSPLSVLNLGECMQKSSCRDAKNITSHTQGNKNVFFVATHTNIMKVTISNGPKKTCTCSIIHNGTNPVLSIATDESNVYWLTSNRSKLMYFPIRRQVSSPLVLTLSQEMHAEYIPHRNAACRIPFYVPDIPNPKLTRANYLEFDLSKIHQRQQSWFSSKICIHENNPNISYAFLYMNLSGNRKKHSIQQSCSGTFDCIYLRVNATSSLESIRLKNLISNSAYLVHVIVFSETKNYKSAVISPGKRFKTACEVPGTVQNLQCTGIDDKNICLSWDKANNVNPEGVRYEVYRNQNTTPKYISNNNAHQSLIFASPPDLMNSFLVKSFAVNCSEIANQYSHFTIQSCQSLQPPQPLQVQEVTGMQATVKWNAPSDGSALYVIIQWAMRISQSTHISWSESEKLNGSDSLIYKVTDLVPNSGYDFRTYQQYIGYTGGEGWRYSEITTAMTAAGVPSFPPSVYVERESDRSFFNWETPNSNGKDLEYYVIEYRNRSSPNATRVLYGSWQSARSISASFNRWQLEKLNENLWYEFRVSAVNAVGHGDVSQPSDPFYYYSIEIAEDDHTMWIVVGTTAGMVLLLFVIILCVACRRCGKETTVVQSPPSSEITTIHLSYGTDLQLAEIRHINDLANLKGIPNIPQDYMDLLPLFPRDKLTLTDFLGRGAFGEVFKGIAHDVDINLGTGRAVAVKTLREGATDSEKCEFLMEAYFMSNFNHENILSLIGVCLDNEPQYLILELMEGGDLLHYVRDARPNPIMGPKLNTASLLDICIDVAAGCKYLEEQRFVHRDLAARNCLVSTRSYRSHQRVVKIGDFGLARDIYRNDYYHKAGEGLLPVRWMAPESLVDNIYTTQSDVW